MRKGRVAVERVADVLARAPRVVRAFVSGLWPALSMGWRRMSAPAFFVASFLVLIGLGTLGLLWLPGLYRGASLTGLDALFTATSAVCVTGLIVVDTATYFTFWGQLWILLLIQLGGIGLITLSTLIIGALGRRLSLRSEMTSVPALHGDDGRPVWRLAGEVARFTMTVEAVGAGLLLMLWLPHFPLDEALWHAVFQSVSAFCNAGFSTFSDSLEGFAQRPLTLLVISALIILGGLGYLTVDELGRRRRANGGPKRRLSTHSFAVLVTTAALLAFGTVSYAAMEWNGALSSLPVIDRLANAWFMSATARTAGFNAVPYAELGNQAALLTIMLMFIGGSPGSTAGGLKTTTLAVLVALAWSRVRGRRTPELHGRSIPPGTLERSINLTLITVAVLTVAFFALNITFAAGPNVADEHSMFLAMGFECMSAFATVGLSMGMTGLLSSSGEVVIILLMFLGRVGVLSFFSALLLRRRARAEYRLASEDLMVG